MAVNINVTEDENLIDINDVNVFTIHVKDLSVPGSIQVQEDVSEISEDTVDTSTEVRVIELLTDPAVNVSINEISNDTVTIVTTDTNVVEISDNIAIVTAATEAASRKLRGFTGDSLWDEFGDNAVYTEGNVGIGTTSPNHKLDVAGNINATTFTGTFIGVISSSAQIASQISGALENLSATVTTNQSNISTRQNETSANQSDIATNQANISTALSRLNAIEITTGSLSQSIDTNISNIAGNLTLISNLQEDSRSFSTRIADVEAGSTSKTLISGSLQIATEISGAFTETSHSLQNRITNIDIPTATEISGAFASTSSSLSLRLSSVEVGSTSKTLISGSTQISTEISGAFVFTSASLESRLSSVEAGSTSKTLLSGSAQIAKSISGSFNNVSASLESRISTVEAGSTSKTLLSGSAQIATAISGAFVFTSSSISSRATSLESKINQSVNTTSDVQFANIEVTNDVSASGIRANSDMQVGGDLAVEGVVFGLKGFAVTIDDISIATGSTQFGSSSLDTHGFTGSMSISGSLSVTGSIDARSISARSINADSFEGIFVGALSSSAQISSNISGSFTEISSSITSRLTTVNTNINANINTISESITSRLTTAEIELTNTLISGSSQLSAEISGAFTTTSASITTRLTTVETELNNTLLSGSNQLATEISGAFNSISSSFEGRLTTVETELNNTLISGSSQLSTEISGAFFESSQSITSRLTTVETELGNTLISSSAQIATDISGAFNNIEFDPGLDTGVVVYDSTAKRLYFTGSYGDSVTSVVQSGTTTQYATSSIAPAVNLSKLVINDFSDTVSVKSDGGILELTFGTPVDPFFTRFDTVGFTSDRFNKEINNYSIRIIINLSGNSFIKGELSASTNNAASVGVTTFTADSTINIDSNFSFYQSGSHTFTARATITEPFGGTREITEVLDLQLNKLLPSNPSIQFTNFNLSGNSPAHNEGDMEIEVGATGNIDFNLIEGNDRDWTAADVHNSSFSPSISVGPTGNITTGKIEEYWNSGTDNDPQEYHTGSAERVFERVRSLRYAVNASPSYPTKSELENLNNWTGTIEAGVDTQSEIESILIDITPDSEYIFIVYDYDLGNLQEVQNTLFGNQNEISAFNSPVTEIDSSGEGYIIYRTALPKRNQFKFKLVFP